MNLTPGGAGFRDVLGVCEAPCVLVADELPPSIAAQLDWTKFEAFITDAGSRTYHTAILARSLHVPAIVGLHDATARIAPGTMILVDGDEGAVSIDPPLEVVQNVTAASEQRRRTGPPFLDYSARSLTTADGVDIRVEANVDLLADAAFAMAQGAEGIGLFRSELLLADVQQMS